MARIRYSKEQILMLLREIEIAIASGKTVPQACKVAKIAILTYYRWRKKYGGPEQVKAKLGRPKLPQSKLKRCIVPVRLNAEDWEAIVSAAKASKQTVSDWIRHTCRLNAAMHERRSAEAPPKGRD